ncbi:MAG: hypothetical protein ACE5JK_01065, partial [Candidatus Omnitrophota bacterium]
TIFVYGGHIAFDNSTGTINGDVGANGSINNYQNMTINGIVSPNEGESGPYSPDFDGYRSIADHIETGHFTFQVGQTYGSPGAEEVWYIEGRAKIEDGVTIYGSVIAPNMTIEMDGISNVDISPGTGMPALVGGTYIEAAGMSNTVISGLVYCGKDLRWNGVQDVTINGSLIGENVFNIQNAQNIQINYDPGLLTDPPPFFEEYTGGGTSVTPQYDWEEIT